MPQRGRKRKSRRQNAGPRVLHDTLLPVVSMQIVQERLRRGPACEEGKKEGACRCPKKEGNESGQEFYTTPAACCVHANPEPCLSEVVRSEQAEPAHVRVLAGNSTTACAASSVVSTACSAHANPAPTQLAFLRTMIMRAATAVRACCARTEVSGQYGGLCSEQLRPGMQL